MWTQEQIKELMLPILKNEGKQYEKFLPVIAKVATKIETIQTITSDGLETQNTAQPGDIIVQNQTQAGEKYIMQNEKFHARYELLETLEGDFARYKPTGKAIGIEITPRFAKQHNLELPFEFMASWGAPMILKENDFLVSPLDFRSVYRIARKEFFETYRLINRVP